MEIKKFENSLIANKKNDAIKRTKESILKLWNYLEYDNEIIKKLKSKQRGVYIEFFDEFYVASEQLFSNGLMPIWFFHIFSLPLDSHLLLYSCNKYYFSSILINKIPEINNEYLNQKLNIDVKINEFKTYVFLDSSGRYKIGKSKNPLDRHKNLECINLGLKIIFIFDIDIELELHMKFESKKLSNEWFKLTNSDLANIYSTYKDYEIFLK